jgi:trimeric autotransporter adhesin
LMILNSHGLRVNGTFVSASDRNVKRDFAPVDSRSVLEKVVSMPLQTWAYKLDPATRHLGPVAQDFKAAFDLGADDKTIATVDADGVALAAIQGLNQKLEQKEDEIRALKTRLDDLEKLVESISRQRK